MTGSTVQTNPFDLKTLTWKILRNTGTERVIDLVRPWLVQGNQLDVVTSSLSLFAFSEILGEVAKLQSTRLVLPPEDPIWRSWGLMQIGALEIAYKLVGSPGDAPPGFKRNVELRRARGPVPQGALVVRDEDGRPQQAVLGSFSFSTDGLGITPGNPLNLIQASETPDESSLLSQWFDAHWSWTRNAAEPEGHINRDAQSSGCASRPFAHLCANPSPHIP